MEIKKVIGNTYVIDTGMTYIPFYKINNQEIIMFDSGWAKGERSGIDDILEKNNFTVVGIICSHAHIDHIGNNAYLKKKHNCIIAMSAYEALVCKSTINLKVYYSTQTLSEVTENFGHMVCDVDKMILDNDEEINMFGVIFKIIHTPGHSPAHICIITPDDVVYLGDTLISYEVMRGAKMPYAYILSEDIKSKIKLYDLKYSQYVVAHKGLYNNIEQLITDNINFYKNRAEKVSDIIEGSMTIDEILKVVIEKFKISVKSKYKYTVLERMLKSYLEYLDETGILSLNLDDGFLRYTKCMLDN